MRDLRKGIRDYLMLRRGLGFKLVKHEAKLKEFASFLERKRSTHITSELALEWATLPAHHQPCQWTARLTIARGFARYWSAIDPALSSILCKRRLCVSDPAPAIRARPTGGTRRSPMTPPSKKGLSRVAGAAPPPGTGRSPVVGRQPHLTPTGAVNRLWCPPAQPIMPTRAAADLHRESRIDSMPPSNPTPAASISWQLAPTPDTTASMPLLRLEMSRAS